MGICPTTRRAVAHSRSQPQKHTTQARRVKLERQLTTLGHFDLPPNQPASAPDDIGPRPIAAFTTPSSPRVRRCLTKRCPADLGDGFSWCSERSGAVKVPTP